PLYFFLERYRDSYLNELGAFFSAVAGEAEVPVTGEDGLRDLVVAMAARTSLREGRPVAISEIEVPVAA
ncbi:Gfo/Idh/MocA family oxidoreductase, partial [Pleomorphomonas carboxyditropha]